MGQFHKNLCNTPMATSNYIRIKRIFKVEERMKDQIKTLIAFILLIIVLCLHPSCTKENLIQSPCLSGDCETNYIVIYKNQPINPNSDGYYEIDWDGLNYFQIEGTLSELKSQYVINKVPLLDARFDSDYWIVMDNIKFQTPMYGYLGWFNDQAMNTPIAIGSHSYTMNNLIDLHPPTNIAGYQIPKHFCTECPYAPTIVGTHSKYTYTPKQNFMLDNEMVGDTINVFIESVFNSDWGDTETIENHIKIIVI